MARSERRHHLAHGLGRPLRETGHDLGNAGVELVLAQHLRQVGFENGLLRALRGGMKLDLGRAALLETVASSGALPCLVAAANSVPSRFFLSSSLAFIAASRSSLIRSISIAHTSTNGLVGTSGRHLPATSA